MLTGCRKGHVPRGAAHRAGSDAAARELDRLTALFGAEHVAVELTDHGDPVDGDRNDALAELAAAAGLPTVATNNVHYATPGRRRLATALAAVRARRSLDEIDGWLPAAATAHLRSGAEMAAPVRRATRARWRGPPSSAPSWPSTCSWSRRSCPTYPVPEPGHTEMSWLRELTMRGAPRALRAAARRTRRRTRSSTTSWT